METKRLKDKLVISWLYPDLMSTYGDRGNIICLKKRCQWRGIGANIQKITLETPVEGLLKSDIIFMGGAQDKQQKIVMKDLLGEKGKILKGLVNAGVPGLFICGAYQFLGKYYDSAEEGRIEGLGIFDLYTSHPGPKFSRLIGNTTIKSHLPLVATNYQLPATSLVGFENHGGRTYLGKNVKPLGKVVKGFGNNGKDQTEGAIFKNAIGTYLHGPILPKNPHLADWLIEKALTKKYGEGTLEPLDDFLELLAHQAALRLR